MVNYHLKSKFSKDYSHGLWSVYAARWRPKSHPPSFKGVALVKRNDFVDWPGHNKNDQSKLRLGQLSNMVLLGRVSSLWVQVIPTKRAVVSFV